MSHEQSITIEIDGKYHNIPSVVGGKVVSDDEAYKAAISQNGLGEGFADEPTAISAAKARSTSFNDNPWEDFAPSEELMPWASYDPSAIQQIDEERGAPMPVRSAVGASKKPEDKLATLQAYYPDATPWGVDNFVFTDPGTGNKTLFNPKGLDMGDVSENARMAFEFLGGSIGGAVAAVAGQLGPQVATPEEIVTVPAAFGLGAAAGGQIYDVLADLFYPNVDTRTFIERSAEVGTDVMVNAIGVRAGELLEIGVKKGVSKGAQLARASGDEIYKAFKRMGVKPTAGAVSGSQTIQGIEQALSKLPASADVIGKEYGKLIDDIGKYADDIVRGVSPIEGREATGEAIKKGSEKFVRQFKVKAGILYDKVDAFIQPGTKVQTNNFGKQLNETLREFAGDPEFAKVLTSPLFKQLKVAHDASVQKGGMSYGTLKALRTKIGAALDDRQLISDTSQAEIKQLYGALSDDMTMAAAQVSPDALRAAERASKFWGAGRARIDDVLTPIVNKKLSQDIFQSAMSGAKSGSQKLRALKKSIPKSEWDAVVANQIKEMGLAKAGVQDVTGEVFSPASFLTNYSKLSKSAQKTLFGGPQYKGLDAAVKDLVTVSAALKDVSKMANTSGTAQQMMYMQLLTGGLGGLYGVERGESATGGAITGMAAGVAAPWVAAKLITSPKFVSWLADSGRVAVTKAGLGAHLGLLAAIAEKDETLAPAINEYMRTISIKKEGLPE